MGFTVRRPSGGLDGKHTHGVSADRILSQRQFFFIRSPADLQSSPFNLSYQVIRIFDPLCLRGNPGSTGTRGKPRMRGKRGGAHKSNPCS